MVCELNLEFFNVKLATLLAARELVLLSVTFDNQLLRDVSKRFKAKISLPYVVNKEYIAQKIEINCGICSATNFSICMNSRA